MSVEDEVMRIRKKLESMMGGGEEADQTHALDLLKALGGLRVDLNVLTTTRIGMTVNALRSVQRRKEEEGPPFFYVVIYYIVLPTHPVPSRLLRKSSRDDDVVATAKSLIKTWKRFVPESSDKKERKREEKRDESGDGRGDRDRDGDRDGDDKSRDIGGKSFPPRWVTPSAILEPSWVDHVE